MGLIPQFRDRLALKIPAGVNLDQGFPYGNCTFAAPLNEIGGTQARNWANIRLRCPVGTLNNGASWTKGKYGPSITLTNPTDYVDFGECGIGAIKGELTKNGVTLMVACRKLTPGSLSVNGSYLIYASDGGTSLFKVQLFTGGGCAANTIYTLFGYGDQNFGAGQINRCIDYSGDNIYTFTSGNARGMEIWRNGVILKSQPPSGLNLGNTDNYSGHFGFGGNTSGGHVGQSEPFEYHFCYVWNYQLPQAVIQALVKNPWQIWLPPDEPGRETPFFGGGGGGTPTPTCSLTASPTSTTPGTPITLTWTTTNTPTSASINQGVGTVTPATGGSTTVTLVGGATTTWTLTVTNAGGSSTCSVTVFAATLGAGCNFVLAAVVGVPYSHTFVATSGTPPFTFSISSGSLPFGLTLTPSTGIVSGTPTQSGIFFFTVTATDSNGLAANVQCSMPVSCP